MAHAITGTEKGALRTAMSRRGRGPLAASLLYVGSWVIGLSIPGTADRSSENADAAASALLHALPATLLQAGLVHGLAGVALYLFVTRVLSRLQLRDSANGRRIAAVGAIAAGLSLAQFVTLLSAALSARLAPEVAQILLRLIDHLDIAKIAVLSALVVALTLAMIAALRSAKWMLPASIVTALLLLVGASSFVIPAAVTQTILAVSLLLLLAWSLAVATLTVRRARQA